jgi:hypothetical protein
MSKPIIKLRHFNNAIDANIAQSKLDAYGIPCFLTNEHFANLYPSHFLSSFQVMLYVFQEDASSALQILDGAALVPEVVCPKCASNNLCAIKPSFLKQCQEFIATIFATSATTTLQSYRCENCFHIFKQR